MASSTDALLALRQAIKSQTPVTYSNASGSTSSLSEATHFTLSPSLSLPKSTPTRLRKAGSTSTDPAASPGDFYTLDAVYVAWLAREAGAGEYMKQARENGLAVGFVSVTERKGIVEWLEGKTDVHASIAPLGGESTTPPGTPPPNRKFLPSTPRAGSSSLTAPQPAGGAKKRYVPDAADKETVKKIKLAEIELRDRNSVLRGTKTNNFAAIQTAFSDKLKKLRDQSKSGTAASTTTAPTPEIKSSSRKGRNVIPIIMISSSPTALITMYNVKQFLQEATFEPSQDAKNRAASEGNSRPEDMIAIYRQRTIIDPSGREIQQNSTYYVVDSVEALSKFGADAWERVVCVMTTGQAWQFRPYKWNEPRTLFHHVRGVYVAWSNDPPNPKIKDWNVALLKIDPNRRHVDKSVVAEFWKTLDGWMMANKPWLMQSK